MTDEERDQRVIEEHRLNLVRCARLKVGLKTGNWDTKFCIVGTGWDCRAIMVSSWGGKEAEEKGEHLR